MPNFGGFFPLSAGIDVPVEVGQGGLEGVLIGNESGLTVIVKMGGNYSRSLYPGWVDYYPIPKSQFSGVITLSPSAMLSNVSSWPSSFAQIDILGLGEHISGTYPAPLMRNANIGNTVDTNVSGTDSISNLGKLPGTAIITAKPSDAASDTWDADNAGNLTIKSDNGGVLTTLLQLIAGASPAVKIAAAGIIAEVLGGLKVDQTFESVGNATLDGTLLVGGASTLDNGLINTDGSGHLILNNNVPLRIKNSTGTAKDVLYVDNANGTNLQGATNIVSLKDSSGNVLGEFNGSTTTFTFISSSNGWTRRSEKIFSGTGSGSFSTGYAVTTPTLIVGDPTTVSGSSQTIGWSLAPTSTVTTGAGLAWKAMAFVV